MARRLKLIVAYDGTEFAGWDADTSWVENSPQSLAWAGQNGVDIAQKRAATLASAQKQAPQRSGADASYAT